MDDAAPLDENALIEGESGAVAPLALADDLAWAVVKMQAGESIVVNAPLIAAYQAASSPHTIRALKSDLEAFDLWCRRAQRIALPATPETIADYLDARAGKGSKLASLGRYKASIAKIHQLLELKDPTPASLVKLRLQAIRRRLGTAQAQARPLRFKGPVRNVERDEPRGLNVRALLESCPEDLPGLRDRALLSAGYDTGLRASELVAIVVEDIIEAIDQQGRSGGGGGYCLSEPADRPRHRGLDGRGRHRDWGSVSARERQALQGAGGRAGPVDRQHIEP
jgi:integrase